MKLIKILLTKFLILLFACGFSQDTKAFRKVFNYYNGWGVYSEQPKPIVYDRKTYKIEITKEFIVPVLTVAFRYEQYINPESHSTQETVLWECKQKDCIFEKAHLQNVSTCRVIFHKKEECLEFIKLLTEFRFAVELKQKSEK